MCEEWSPRITTSPLHSEQGRVHPWAALQSLEPLQESSQNPHQCQCHCQDRRADLRKPFHSTKAETWLTPGLHLHMAHPMR